MKRVRSLFFLMGMVLFAAACAADELPPTQTVSTPTQFAIEVSPRSPMPTQTPLPLLLPATPETTPFPVWVTNFADPILSSLVGRRPDFQDDFSPLNRGWFYDIDSRPYYAHINDGALVLKLPEGKEKEDFMVYNPTLSRRNFVLSFDLRFWETQPDDYVRFQFNPTADQNFSLDLSKDQSWNFRWAFHDELKSITGPYEHFPPERISVVFIVQDNKCAVYLNHDPLDYSSICMIDSKARRSLRAVSFHMVAVPDHTATVTIDNVKMWDLDEIPVYPRHP